MVTESCYLGCRGEQMFGSSPLSRGESTACTRYAIRCRFARPLTSLFLKTKVQLYFEPVFYCALAGLCLMCSYKKKRMFLIVHSSVLGLEVV